MVFGNQERAWENLSRMSAEKTDPQFERDLLKIATKYEYPLINSSICQQLIEVHLRILCVFNRGVVQLFNAISTQQKTIRTKLRNTKKSEFAKDKVLSQTKDIFDSALTKSKREQNQIPSGLSGDVKIKEESDDDNSTRKRKSNGNHSSSSAKKPAWTALQDDFMLDAKLKDWDKESSSSSGSDSE